MTNTLRESTLNQIRRHRRQRLVKAAVDFVLCCAVVVYFAAIDHALNG